MLASYDIVIVGGGPAGLSAAIYGRRAERSVLVLEKNGFGGQIAWSPKVDNFPGIPEISGAELADRMFAQALDMGAQAELAEVTGLRREGKGFAVITPEGEYAAKTVILATGAQHRRLGVPREEELAGNGVCYCAVCDGAFYKDRPVAVAGGGDAALQDALLLSNGSSKVYILHRRDEFRAEAAKYNKLFSEHGIAQLDIDAEWQRVREAAAYLAPRVCDTVYSINAALKAGKKVLCEGAQGALLDIDHGTYPFVTSSNTTSGGACTGAGIAPQHVRDCWGVIKAYTTRVGEGPFPTELFDEAGEQLRQVGREFGATTGRPRRCGWFDAVAAHYACMVDGVNKLAVTKLDVLDGFEKIAVCVAYEIDGRITKEFPASIAELQAVKPVLEWLPGWQCETSGATCWNDLPENARNYLKRMAELVDSSIAVVSVGPRRDQTFTI